MNARGKTDKTAGRAVEGTLQKDLGRMDQLLKGHLIEGAKTPLEVLQRHYPLQDVGADLSRRQSGVQVLHSHRIRSGFRSAHRKLWGARTWKAKGKSLLNLRWSMTR